MDFLHFWDAHVASQALSVREQSIDASRGSQLGLGVRSNWSFLNNSSKEVDISLDNMQFFLIRGGFAFVGSLCDDFS